MSTCWFCNGEMGWNGDFSGEDYGIENGEDMVVANLTCRGCGATAEFYSPVEEEEIVTKHMILNPKTNVVEAIRKRLVITEGYCPCLAERTEDTICPCKAFREEQHCCCSLYVEEGGKY